MRFAVTMNHRPEETPPRDVLQHAYVPFVQSLGLLPVLIPNTLADVVAYAELMEIDGLVLTGGVDVAPERYGEQNTASEVSAPQRDETEFRLLDWAVERGFPVIGICRGSHVINTYFGGKMIQDIPSMLRTPVNHDDGATHPVRIADARARRAVGVESLTVNSYHHQAIVPERLAPGLVPFAVSPADGIVEGVYHPGCSVIAVQWHPERPSPSREQDAALFTRFLHGEF